MVRRYFFQYHLVLGIPFPLMWAEDNGVCVGGRPSHLVGKKVEITSAVFEKGELTPLEKEFPAYSVKGLISITEVEEPDKV